jgi:Na+-transporting NADH:ubiquinone oxidoreductase subunit NqrC
MENFDNIPSNGLKVEVKHLINKLNSNAGLYDSDEVLAALYALRKGIQEASQKQLRRRDRLSGAAEVEMTPIEQTEIAATNAEVEQVLDDADAEKFQEEFFAAVDASQRDEDEPIASLLDTDDGKTIILQIKRRG